MHAKTAVIGAGPVGCVLALVLQRHGMQVEVFERRPDMRRAEAGAGRSINLVLTARGLRALRLIGLEEEVLALTVPVFGRMMHALDGELTYTPYGKDERERNHSVSRGELNVALLEAVVRAGIPVHFEHTLEEADLSAGVSLRFSTPRGAREVSPQRAFGADGAPSALRSALMAVSAGRCELEMLADGYKELLFPAAPEGGYALDPRALHIWPRGVHMLMGLPNRDGSFTGTLYLPHEGECGFSSLQDESSIEAFFAKHYPDAIPALAPDYAREVLEAPLGKLGTVRCFPWRLDERVLLVGDAAHAIVPFFGQGLNAGFEDVAVLHGLLGEHGRGALAEAFGAYEAARKPAGDAIAEMALENYVEMRDKSGDEGFILRKRVQARLEQALAPAYRTRYAMVVYSSIPYHEAQAAGRVQDEIVSELCAGLSDAADLDLARAEALVREKLTPFVRARGIDLNF